MYLDVRISKSRIKLSRSTWVGKKLSTDGTVEGLASDNEETSTWFLAAYE